MIGSGKGDRLPINGAGGLDASVLDVFFTGWAAPPAATAGRAFPLSLLLLGGAGLAALYMLRR